MIVIVMQQGPLRNRFCASLVDCGVQLICRTSLRNLLADAAGLPEPRLIIIELTMTDALVWRYCNLLRTQEISPWHDVPVLLVSQLYVTEMGDVLRAETGADGYFHYEDNPTALVATATTLMRSGRRPLSSRRVILIEDDPVLPELMAKKFAANNWCATQAPTIQDGFRELQKKSYDLAVINCHLSDGKGDSLLTEIAGTCSDTPVLMITSDVTPELALDWLAKAAAAFLLKPFSCDYLYETANRRLREKIWCRVASQLEEKTGQLQAREQLIKDIEDTMGDVLWQRDLDLHYRYVSPAITRITGFTVSETVGMYLDQEMTADSAIRFRQLVADGLAGLARKPPNPRQWREFFELRCRSGEVVTVECRFSFKIDASGQPVGLSGMMKDNLEVRQHREKIDLLESAISQVDDVIIITDTHGRLEFANASFTRVTGYEPAEWMGTETNILTSGIHNDDFFRSLWATITGGKTWIGQITNRRKDGSLYQERVKISSIRNSKNEIVKYIAVKRDLTQELEIACEKQELEEKYLQAQRLEAIGVFAMGIIHDFNNILTPIVGYANLIKVKYADDSLIQDHINQILLAGDRAKGLVQQMLRYSRGGEAKTEPIDIRLLLKESIQLARAFLPPRVTISLQLEKHDFTINMDPTKFSQLVMNLITNSYHALEGKRGDIRIGLARRENKQDGAVVYLRVADTGSGIPAEIRDRIFEPFFTTKTTDRGTGLGLSVCRTLVEEAGGRIALEYSTAERGTSIMVTLPFMAPATAGCHRGQLPDTRFDGKGRRVMLVDDEKLVLNYLSTALKRLNFHVDAFSDAKEALRRFSAFHEEYSFIFTDMEMPHQNGIELVKGIRQLRGDIPVIICTGNIDPQLEASVEGVNRMELLDKPVTINDMSVALTRLFAGTDFRASWQ